MTLSKRLKRRIQELCGLPSLKREEKVIRANEILNSTEIKQSICNQILGCTFKDIEKSMVSVINERQLTEAQKEQLELEKVAPDKFDYDFQFKLNKKALDEPKPKKYGTLTREEAQALIEASKSQVMAYDKPPRKEYPTLPREEAERLVREYFEYKEKERQKKEQWDSLKTTELETKIVPTKKRTRSTKT